MIENTLRINNPATGIKITRVQKDDAESVQQKYQLLKNGQPEWANTPLSERLWCIEQFFRLLDVERVDLAETLTAEMGKPFQEALNEIQGARGRIHFFLNNTSNSTPKEHMNTTTPPKHTQSRADGHAAGKAARLIVLLQLIEDGTLDTLNKTKSAKLLGVSRWTRADTTLCM